LASRLELKFVALNPFSEDVVKSFIKGTTRCEDGEPVLKILFPNHPEGPDWFFQQMYIYSGGVPIYLVHILRELVELRETRKGTDLSEDDMEAMIGSIPMNTSVLIVPAYMSPETMNVFCSMLLASFLELRFDQKSFVNVNGHRRSLLDVANALGFYCAVVSTEGKQTSAKQADFIKLIYPKYALQYLKLSYWKHPPIRFLHSLFPSICPEDSPSTRGYKFEILFSLILYVRLSVCKQLGELGIFRQSLVEEIPKDADDEYISRIVPSFRSKIDGDHSAGEKSYSTSAWKKFFDKYLSKDGIFFPNRQNSSGPDVILRVSAPLDGVSSAPKEGQSSQKQISIEETSSDKKRIYSIGIALKYYNLSGPGVDFSMIRREVAKFLEPVSSQLELKGNNNITAIQLIVCNKYHENVLRHFTDHQNLVLNSGVYYEDDDGNLKSNLSDFSSYSKKKWLEVHVNCQVVICSPQNLKDFLGSSVYENLERGFNDDGEKFEDFDPLKDMLERSFQGLWTDIPYEEPPGYLGLTTEPDMLSTESMNVKRTERKGAKADSSVVSVRQGQFDWMEFLKTYCDLTESEARECCDTVKVMREQEFASVDTAILEGLGIEDPMTRLKIVAGIRRYIRKKPRS